MFDQFYTTLESLGIVPVVVLDKVEDAAPLAHALMKTSQKAALYICVLLFTSFIFSSIWLKRSSLCKSVLLIITALL